MLTRLTPLLLVLLLTGCAGGAVVFAPAPPPPDLSPLLYAHPSGAFTVTAPRNWSLYTQNTTVLASASLARPGESAPSLRFAVTKTPQAIDSAEFLELMNQYQQRIRPDVRRYKEITRQAMGDGSWRITGLRDTVGGLTEQVNTFVQRSGQLLGIAEAVIPGNGDGLAELQQVINSFVLLDDATLDVSGPEALGFTAAGRVDVTNVMGWMAPSGAFFITGEVTNNGSTVLTDVPVRAALKTADGLVVAEAADMVMGHGIVPGGFAPFSLRFGQGMPGGAVTFDLTVGSSEWMPSEDRLYGSAELRWTDSSTIEPDGTLIISGTVRNTSGERVLNPRVVATVFDGTGRAIAAGFADLAAGLDAGATASFRLAISEMGGEPVNYLVSVQGRP